MSLILLISSNQALAEGLKTILSTDLSVVRLTTVAEAQSYLYTLANDRELVRVILFHAENSLVAATDCRKLRYHPVSTNIPQIAILARPEDRQVALEAGANDYLLLPLLPIEVKTRLKTYLHSPFHTFYSLSTVIDHLRTGTMLSAAIWEQDLQNLAQTFKAPSAWVILFDPQKEKPVLKSGYNLPPILINHPEEIEPFFEKVSLGKESSNTVELYTDWINNPQSDHLTYHATIPLHSGRQLFGVLTLAYPERPQLSQFEKQSLNILGQSLGILLESQYIQDEIQLYATQNAFIVLIARTISERLDLEAIFSLTLEQVVPLFNASGGDIWLLDDNDELDLASSLSSPSMCTPSEHCEKGQGLIGWVVEHQKAIHAPVPHQDPRFDPKVDRRGECDTYSLLAVPFRHRGTIIGALALYNENGTPFANRDTMLLEGIASLTASAIANARLLQELRENADQRRVLYEMSQQIAAGLDLNLTLNRILHWMGRLFSTEIGLLWLVEESTEKLRLAATSGIDLPTQQPIDLSLKKCLFGWVTLSGETVVSNDPATDHRFDNDITIDILKIAPRNIIAAPMTYHGQSMGVLSLVNKNSGPFDETDLTLLSTSLEMVAVAVSNAKLYTRTIALMEDKERLHQQVLQSERLATVGRLTGSLSHEINNPMQAIQGALTLAMEELDNPKDLATYIQMSMQESERVVKLLNRMRQIYRPQTDVLEALDLNHILQEATALARKELKRQKITLYMDLAPDLPQLVAVANQLHLVFLSILLNLSDAIGATGGGRLKLHTYKLSQTIRIEFLTETILLTDNNRFAIFKPNPRRDEAELSFGLSLSQDIIVAHNGKIDLTHQKDQTICRIELPISTSN